MVKWIPLFWVVGSCFAGRAAAQMRSYGKDTVIITGEVDLRFILDKNGKCAAVYSDTTANDPELVREVVRVVSKMNQTLIMQPTRASGQPLVSVVGLKVAFEEWENPPKTPSKTDLTIGVGPVRR